MREQYGADPEEITSLIPPVRKPPLTSDEDAPSAGNRYLDLISTSYQRLATAVEKLPAESTNTPHSDVSGTSAETSSDTVREHHHSKPSEDHRLSNADDTSPTSEQSEVVAENEENLPVATLVTAVPLHDEDAHLNTVHIQELNEALIEAEKKEDIHMKDNFTYW